MKNVNQVAREITDAIWELLQDALKDENMYGNKNAANIDVDQMDNQVTLSIPSMGTFTITVEGPKKA